MYVVGEEYKPSFSSTVNRIKERGYVVCGTYADTGFSEEFLKDMMIVILDGMDLT